MKLIFSFFSYSLRFAVKEKFYFISIIIVCPKVNRFTFLPIPVRKNVKNVFFSSFGLIHIIYILRESVKIYNSKIRTPGRPTVRNRFSKVIKTCPYIHSANKIVILHQSPAIFMSSSPRYMTIVIRRTG